ncbi:MAG: glyoxalase/bleomycin resistance/dioxygenase family protein, partial [Mycobacteriaceae bacterium]
VTGPAGERWEVYTVLADSESFGASPEHPAGDAADSGEAACCAPKGDDEKVAVSASCC